MGEKGFEAERDGFPNPLRVRSGEAPYFVTGLLSEQELADEIHREMADDQDQGRA